MAGDANEKVCPRCGAPASEGIWCQSCGLNLGQQRELPTAEAYAAAVREREWLEEQDSEQKAGLPVEAASPAGETNESISARRGLQGWRTWFWALLATGAVFGVGVFAWLLISGDSDSPMGTPGQDVAATEDATAADCPSVSDVVSAAGESVEANGIRVEQVDCETAAEVIRQSDPLDEVFFGGNDVQGFTCAEQLPGPSDPLSIECDGPDGAVITAELSLSSDPTAAATDPADCPSFQYDTSGDAWSASEITVLNGDCEVARSIISQFFDHGGVGNLEGGWECSNSGPGHPATCESPNGLVVDFEWSIAVE